MCVNKKYQMTGTEIPSTKALSCAAMRKRFISYLGVICEFTSDYLHLLKLIHVFFFFFKADKYTQPLETSFNSPRDK